MAFPISPSDGDTYKNYIWDSSTQSWQKIGQVILSGQIGSALENPITVGKLAFNEFWTNKGGINYDSGSRRFYVPISGTYRITLNPFKKTDATAYRLLVGVNMDAPTTSNHRGHAYGSTLNAYETGSINSVVDLNAGDFIVFYLQVGSLYNIGHDKFNQFTIERIGE